MRNLQTGQAMSQKTITRREQLQLLLLGASAPVIYGISSLIRMTGRVLPEKNGEFSHIQSYRALGGTGLKVSDVGFGVSCSIDPQLMVNGYRRGINYFDISPMFTWSVEMLAEAFARDAGMKRDAVVASKIESMGIVDTVKCMDVLGRGGAFNACVVCIDKTLKKLGRSHIDILQIHGVGQNGAGDLDWLDPNTARGSGAQELFTLLKRQGKVRFTGITSHGPSLLDEVAEKCAGNGSFDAMMLALNFMKPPSPALGQTLGAAGLRGMGITAMKVLANGQNAEPRPGGGRRLSHAAISWALSQPGVSNMVITIDSPKTLNEYISASGRKLTSSDLSMLQMHCDATSGQYCRVDCGQCNRACPNGVDIATILRIDQYRSNYRQREMARERYMAFDGRKRLTACLDCQDPVCEINCPFGLPVRARLQLAYLQLDPGGDEAPA